MAIGTSIITDPRITSTLSEFLIASQASNVVTYRKLSFVEVYNNIEYVIKNVLDDYLYNLQQASVSVSLTTEQQLKYNYRPKLLASDVYGSTEFHYVIMRMNSICDIKYFTMNPVLMLNQLDMNNFISTIYRNEQSALQAFDASS